MRDLDVGYKNLAQGDCRKRERTTVRLFPEQQLKVRLFSGVLRVYKNDRKVKILKNILTIIAVCDKLNEDIGAGRCAGSWVRNSTLRRYKSKCHS